MDQAGLRRDVFGRMPNGDVVEAVSLTNMHGMSVRIITYGAAIQSVDVPDRHGVFADVTTGHATLDDYIAQPQFFGATVGRVANRLSGARFTLDGGEYHLPANDGSHSLHGGDHGFDKANWKIVRCNAEETAVTLQHHSADGAQGYPGNLNATATYTLDQANALTIEYRATTDAPTPVNLSNHAYWNLGGEGSAYGALEHMLTIHADHFLPVDAGLIPTGEQRCVDGSVFDFRTAAPIGIRVRNADDPQIGFGRGYDHCWITNDHAAHHIRPVARLADTRSGRTLTLSSNQPGLQFYSGNFLDGTSCGKAGSYYRMGDAVVLEPQHFPDAPNQPSFPSITLRPGQTYSNIMVWQFGVMPMQDQS